MPYLDYAVSFSLPIQALIYMLPTKVSGNQMQPKFERIVFFDPKRDKHHVGGCFVAVKLGKAAEGRQDTKIFGPRCPPSSLFAPI